MKAEIAAGKGEFFVSGHISNWELLAFSYPVLTSQALNIITKRQASRKLNVLINEYRSLGGNKMIETGLSLKDAFRVVKNREAVCFLIDQAGHPDYSVYVDFFGRKTATFAGPAKLALTERPLLCYIYMIREKDYSYTVVRRKIQYDDLIGRSDENVTELSQRIQNEVMDTVRNHPAQWLWFHKRFKHTREG